MPYFQVGPDNNVYLHADSGTVIASTYDNWPPPADPAGLIAAIKANAAAAPSVPPWPARTPGWYCFISLVWPSGFGWNFAQLDPTGSIDENILAMVAPSGLTREQAKAALADFQAHAASYPVR